MKAKGRIWLIGGTQESAQLAAAIAEAQLACTVSVTTETAKQLYASSVEKAENHTLLRVWVGRLTVETAASFLQQQQIVAVLDASHPYAIEISQLAIAITTQLGIPYLRFERPDWKDEGGGMKDEREKGQEKGLVFQSFAELVATDILQGQRVLLIVGYRPLTLFQPWQDRATLFARLLPSVTAIEAAIAAGFTPDRLFAMRPPISPDLEKALWQHWQISVVITKSSGIAGGEDVKRKVAMELEIPLVAIARPPITYPQQTSDLTTALRFCHQHLSCSSSSFEKGDF
ncbi:cobalt-precorrin-6A reductase [Trichocoleus sp. FACHB-262]|uniref:cobalt-precorrin-6A reductase n=1 Tax=Trichocoleus sp. FACHB-262 TaxID=2692869 RepID=UPI0016861E4A|nr:cobalt-precorrin-6A reductase [Trichocoleus sp. FACHB-262]MBD2119710.1 cobalt-precorrin-6A reductase [Trichocoleus sp. FACHB-262]